MSDEEVLGPFGQGAGLPVMPHLSVEERVARGKAARREVPIDALGEYKPNDYRPDPIELLKRQEATRVPDLVPIRHGRMLVSPFTFYRGAALIMASDLGGMPSPGLRAQLCGDAHLSNFGIFASPERRLVFDLNDFDETSPGPFEWDVMRLAASFELAGRDRGFTEKEITKAVLASATSYRDAMRSFAAMPNLDLWYARLEMDQVMQDIKGKIRPERYKLTEEALAKARTRDSVRAYGKLTEVIDGKPRFRSEPPLLVPVEELWDTDTVDGFYLEVRGILREYRSTLQSDRRHFLEEYEFTHLARKVVGVGSVGTRAFVMLMMGRDLSDPLILQVKEANASVLEDFAGSAGFDHHGQRVVAGQHLMQANSDIFLGWQRVLGMDGYERDYYIRQLHDMKASIDVDVMQPVGLAVYAQLCGWTLARGHARSGDRIAIASYLGGKDRFDQAMLSFARAYADQGERDYEQLKRAVAEGRVEATTGV